MKKSIKTLKIAAFILIGFIIITMTFLVLVRQNKGKQDDISKYNISELHAPKDKTSTVFKLVNDYSIYFSAKNILTDYITYFEKINGDVEFEKGRIQLSDEEIRGQRYEAGIKAITQIFDEQYKNMEAYNEEKIKSYVEKYKNSSGNTPYTIYITEMYKADIKPNCILVLVYTKVNGNDFNCMIKIDWNNNNYSIFWDDYLEKNNYTKDRTEEIDIESNIEESDFNTFIASYPNNQDIAIKYFDDLKYKIKNNPNELYNDLLDSEYKEKRFPSTDQFAEFLEEIKYRISNMDITQYKFDNNQISVVDNYENIYTFKISNVMEYKVLLDNYTIKNDELKKLYNKSNEEGKVNSNIKEFFNMINMKDYNGIYNKLDNNFKSNNYSTLNDLKSYIQHNLYDYCVMEETVDAKKDGSTYIYTIAFSDGENKGAETKEITIVMQLKEGTDYVMSFSME